MSVVTDPGSGNGAPPLLRIPFLLLAAFSLTPWASPALTLTLGAVFVLVLGNPFPAATARLSRTLLQVAVVGLGFGMPLAAVIRTGAQGLAYTVVVVLGALTLGLWMGRQLQVDGQTSLLVTSGTSICGGTAIAAVGSAIGARAEAMSVALATVFLLNVVALYLFPPLGHLLELSQLQFGVWAAVAIHDTSSVVGAASVYGPEALEHATVLKLARTLWLIPLTLGTAAWVRRGEEGVGAGTRPGVRIPWFVAFFVLAALLRSAAPEPLLPTLDAVARGARVALVLVLFLIGAGLTRATLRAVGVRPLLHATLLWFLVAGGPSSRSGGGWVGDSCSVPEILWHSRGGASAPASLLLLDLEGC